MHMSYFQLQLQDQCCTSLVKKLAASSYSTHVGLPKLTHVKASIVVDYWDLILLGN